MKLLGSPLKDSRWDDINGHHMMHLFALDAFIVSSILFVETCFSFPTNALSIAKSQRPPNAPNGNNQYR